MRVSNSLGPDQDRRAVGPDLGTNCLQRLSTDAKIRHWQGTSKEQCSIWLMALSVSQFGIVLGSYF